MVGMGREMVNGERLRLVREDQDDGEAGQADGDELQRDAAVMRPSRVCEVRLTSR